MSKPREAIIVHPLLKTFHLASKQSHYGTLEYSGDSTFVRITIDIYALI